MIRLLPIGLLVLAIGCDSSERITRLEKQNQVLQEEVKKNSANAEYDMQAKCSRDAKTWFNENWSTDRNTLLLDFTNHYSRALNKCFIAVENHRKNLFLGEGSWVNEILLTDVQENLRYGLFRADHESC